MCYRGYGYPLTLFLEEGGVVTVCKINTQEPEEPIDFEFCSTNVTNKVNFTFSVIKTVILNTQKNPMGNNKPMQMNQFRNYSFSGFLTLQIQWA